LENNWKFIETEGGTEISFDIDFEIENKFLNVLMSKSFEFGFKQNSRCFSKKS
jgi:coenzyme Q-binding protein COQ10